MYVADGVQKLIDVFKPEAGGKEKYATQIAGTCPSEGTTCKPEEAIPFTEPARVAVDEHESSGDVLLLDHTEAGYVVDVFEPEALGAYKFLFTIAGPRPGEPFAEVDDVAVDGSEAAGGGEIYVAEQRGEAGYVDQFSSTGAYLGRITGAPAPRGNLRRPESIALDPESPGYVYVGDYREGATPQQPSVVDVFGPDVVAPDVATEAASEVRAHDATLNGKVSPLKAETGEGANCRFVWGTTAAFGHSVPCSPETEIIAEDTPVTASLSALEPDTTYYYRLQASNAKGTNLGEEQEPEPECDGQPAAVACFTTSGSRRARGVCLAGQAAPRRRLTRCSIRTGSATSYYFQYGRCEPTGPCPEGYEDELPAAPGLAIGAGEGDQTVSVHLQGLAPGTTYHYRVVVLSAPSGEAVTVEGPDARFTTQGAAPSSGALAAADGRQWEMVSPPNKQGAGILALGNEQGDDVQAAADGAGIVYGASSPFVADPAGNRSPEVVPVLSTRDPAGGVLHAGHLHAPRRRVHGPGAGALLRIQAVLQRPLARPGRTGGGHASAAASRRLRKDGLPAQVQRRI